VFAHLVCYISGVIYYRVIIDLETQLLADLIDPVSLLPLNQPFSGLSFLELLEVNNLQIVSPESINTKIEPESTETVGNEVGSYTDSCTPPPPPQPPGYDDVHWGVTRCEQWEGYGAWPSWMTTGPYTTTETYDLPDGQVEHILVNHEGSLKTGIDYRFWAMKSYWWGKIVTFDCSLLDTSQERSFWRKTKTFHRNEHATCQLVLDAINNGAANYEFNFSTSSTAYHSKPVSGPTVGWSESSSETTIKANSVCDNSPNTENYTRDNTSSYYDSVTDTSETIYYYPDLNMALHREFNQFKIYKSEEDYNNDIFTEVKKYGLIYSYVDQTIEDDPPILKMISEGEMISFFNLAMDDVDSVQHEQTLIPN